jgi:hypothetical protein
MVGTPCLARGEWMRMMMACNAGHEAGRRGKMRMPWPRWLGLSFAGFGRDARPCGVCVHALVGEWLDMNKARQPIYSPIMLHSQTLRGVMLSTYCTHDTNMILLSGGHLNLSSLVPSRFSLLCLSIHYRSRLLCRGPQALDKASKALGKAFAEPSSRQSASGKNPIGKGFFAESRLSGTRQSLCRASDARQSAK